VREVLRIDLVFPDRELARRTVPLRAFGDCVFVLEARWELRFGHIL